MEAIGVWPSKRKRNAVRRPWWVSQPPVTKPDIRRSCGRSVDVMVTKFTVFTQRDLLGPA